MNYLNFYVASAVLLITLLAINVSRVRIQEKIANGDGNNRTLQKAIRAHMNNLEHLVPFGLVIFVLSTLGLNTASMATLSVGFIGLRVWYSYSLFASKFRQRQLVAGLTYLYEVVGCILIFAHLG